MTTKKYQDLNWETVSDFLKEKNIVITPPSITIRGKVIPYESGSEFDGASEIRKMLKELPIEKRTETLDQLLERFGPTQVEFFILGPPKNPERKTEFELLTPSNFHNEESHDDVEELSTILIGDEDWSIANASSDLTGTYLHLIKRFGLRQLAMMGLTLEEMLGHIKEDLPHYEYDEFLWKEHGIP